MDPSQRIFVSRFGIDRTRRRGIIFSLLRHQRWYHVTWGGAAVPHIWKFKSLWLEEGRNPLLLRSLAGNLYTHIVTLLSSPLPSFSLSSGRPWGHMHSRTLHIPSSYDLVIDRGRLWSRVINLPAHRQVSASAVRKTSVGSTQTNGPSLIELLTNDTIKLPWMWASQVNTIVYNIYLSVCVFHARYRPQFWSSPF